MFVLLVLLRARVSEDLQLAFLVVVVWLCGCCGLLILGGLDVLQRMPVANKRLWQEFQDPIFETSRSQ